MFSLAINTVRYLPCSNRLTSFIFWKLCHTPKSEEPRFSVLFHKKTKRKNNTWCSTKRRAGSTYNAHPSCRSFSQDNLCSSIRTNTLCLPATLITQNIKPDTQRPVCNKSNHFCCFIKDNRWKWLVFQSVRKVLGNEYIWCQCPHWCTAPAFYPSVPKHHWCR